MSPAADEHKSKAKQFVGPSRASVLRKVHQTLGEDAIIVDEGEVPVQGTLGRSMTKYKIVAKAATRPNASPPVNSGSSDPAADDIIPASPTAAAGDSNDGPRNDDETSSAQEWEEDVPSRPTFESVYRDVLATTPDGTDSSLEDRSAPEEDGEEDDEVVLGLNAIASPPPTETPSGDTSATEPDETVEEPAVEEPAGSGERGSEGVDDGDSSDEPGLLDEDEPANSATDKTLSEPAISEQDSPPVDPAAKPVRSKALPIEPSGPPPIQDPAVNARPALLALGVPSRLAPPGPLAALELMRSISEVHRPVPPMPNTPDDIVVVAGHSDLLAARGATLAAAGYSVVLASPTEVPTAGLPSHHARLTSPSDATDLREGWRPSAHKATAVLLNVEDPNFASITVRNLQPSALHVLAAADNNPADVATLAKWLSATAVDVVGFDTAATPGLFLASEVPVATIDGYEASPAAWSALLIQRCYTIERTT